MRQRIMGIMLSAALALAASLAFGQEPKPTACGIQAATSAAEYYVTCVDFDRLRELTGMPSWGKVTQVFVDPRDQAIKSLRVTVTRGHESRSWTVFPQENVSSGRRIAVAVFEGMDWETVLIEEK